MITSEMPHTLHFSTDGYFYIILQAMLHYKSPLLQTLDTLAYSPFLLFGSREQKQLVNVEFFSNYLEDAVSDQSFQTFCPGVLL
jgi:hypothetical protein